MLTVHHLENSRSQRILWLLEELGLEYTIQHYKRDPQTSLAPAELFNIHPLGKSPVITDNEITVAESGAIVEYLVEKYASGRLIPPSDTSASLQYRYWLHYAEGTLMPLMMIALIFAKINKAPMPFFARPIAKRIVTSVEMNYLSPNIKRNLDYIEQVLSQSTWLAGAEMTAADILMSYPLEAAAERTKLIDACPNIAAFLERIHALPAYQRALEKGGPYQLLS